MVPEDIRELALPVLGHRIILKGNLKSRSGQIPAIIEDILKQVEVPTEEWSREKKG